MEETDICTNNIVFGGQTTMLML